MPDLSANRRDFLRRTSVAGLTLFSSTLVLTQDSEAALRAAGQPGAAVPTQKPDDNKDKDKGEEISPAEDLMREHGVLNRILLIYDHHLQMLNAKHTFDGSILVDAADLVRRFVEDYHEKLEEDFLFPRFRKAKKLTNLVDTLQAQHKAGRDLTAQIKELAGVASLKYVSSDADKLSEALRAFLRMYRPHEAREDTVLFPAFRSIVSKHEYDALGDDFEKKEAQLFGEDGFFKIVAQVGDLEKRLGIYDLAQFTPRT